MYRRIGERVLWVRVATTAIPAHRPVVLDQLGELRRRAVERVVEPLLTGSQVEDPARSEAHEPRLRKGGYLRQNAQKGRIIERRSTGGTGELQSDGEGSELSCTSTFSPVLERSSVWRWSTDG